jgi:Tol biopolymer transport system component
MCACLVACGRVDFDGSPTDVRPADAPTGPFGSPTLLTELSSGFDQDDPTLTGDQLEIFFESTRNGSFDLYTATRNSITDTWSSPTLVTELDSADGEACPEISTDGLTMMFSSARPGGKGGYELYITRRMARGSLWSMPTLVPELNSGASDYGAVVASSNLEVGFHSDRAGGAGGRDLYRATRMTVTSLWEPPVEIGELDTGGDDESLFFLPGDLEIMFGSNRSGNRDIYEAVRPAIGQPFGTPTPITSLDTPSDESDPWLSPDGHTIVFSSNRSGIDEVWQATR